jgi:hypothetical protein
LNTACMVLSGRRRRPGVRSAPTTTACHWWTGWNLPVVPAFVYVSICIGQKGNTQQQQQQQQQQIIWMMLLAARYTYLHWTVCWWAGHGLS